MEDHLYLIDKYFNNEFTAEESQLFQSLLASDTAFLEAFTLQKNLQASIEISERKKLKAMLQSHEHQKFVANKKKPMWIWMSIAASILALVFISIFLNKPSGIDGEALYAHYYQKYPNVIAPIERGDQPNVDPLTEALQNYEAKSYEKALLDFQHLYAIEPKEEYKFYEAMIYMELGQLDPASAILQSYEWTDNYTSKSKWYLALIAISNKKYDSARTYLQEIIKINKDYTEFAKSLLAEIQ